MKKHLTRWSLVAALTVGLVIAAREPLGQLLGELPDRLPELLDTLPVYLSGHLLLSLASLATGLGVSLPLGILASRRPRLREWALGVFGVIQTVPTLALLALTVMLLAGRIGFLPAFIALTLYSVLPILANTVTGIAGVNPALTEAARGMGMTSRQVLFRVELPLAAPVILAGVRTATVLVVGTATLVTPVGGVSLGNYIFGGLESLNHWATVFGCVLAALLAILLDQLICVLQRALDPRRRSRRLARVAAAGVLLVLAGGLYQPVVRAVDARAELKVASGPFTEQHILNAALSGQLEQAGFRVERRLGMSEGIQFQALFRNQVDCIVNYTGNIYTLLMKRDDFQRPGETLNEVSDYLLARHGVVCLGPLGFENAYAVAAPQDRAKELKGSLENLGAYADAYRARTGQRLRIGGDNMFFERPEWRRLKERYALNEGTIETVAMDPTLMYGAARDGRVQVIVAYTSDGRIPAFGLTLLDDPRRAFPPYDAVLLLSPAAASRPELRAALEPLVGAIRLPTMQQANHRVDVEKWAARRAAEELLQRIESKP